MTPEQKAALEKIKKLLRMKRGGTPDEIATALRLAQELADKHGIDLDSVNPDQDSERQIGHEYQHCGARIQWECKYAMLIAAEFFHVEAFLSGKQGSKAHGIGSSYGITFVGTDWDRQIATHVYYFLRGHFGREWTRAKRECMLRSRQTFLYGMFLGLYSKLRNRQPNPIQQPGIIPVNRQLERRKKYIEDNFGSLNSTGIVPAGDASKAKWTGWLAGQDTEIRPAVNKGDRSVALLS